MIFELYVIKIRTIPKINYLLVGKLKDDYIFYINLGGRKSPSLFLRMHKKITKKNILDIRIKY